MAYADYTYYISQYLLGKEPPVPASEFDFWEKQARRELDAYTCDRLIANPGLITEKVKDCTCAVAELLYKANNLSEKNLEEGAAGPLASYSNDGESGSFNLQESIYTESGKKKEIRRLVYLYLGNTGLLYSGI